MSQHSIPYFVCNKFRAALASKMLHGAVKRGLPGQLHHQGDRNIFCQLADYVRSGMERQILPALTSWSRSCVVQELFVNRQKAGARTNQHLHPDDFWGGIFYLETPP